MLRQTAFLFCACAFAASAWGQHLKPGLWEVTNNMKSASGEMERNMAQMQQQLASMPPDQRRMMEEMMAKQGVKMGGAGPGGMSTRVCLTKQMIERNEIHSERGDCKVTKQERRGSTIRMAYQCANPPSTGEGEYTVVSPDAYTMKMTVRTTAQGRPETMQMNGSGKWLGSDCGNIQPRR